MTIRTLLCATALLVAACGDTTSTTEPLGLPSTTSTTTASTDPAPSTTAPPSTTSATDPTEATTTTAPTCQATGSTVSVSDDFPEVMSALVGKDIRTGEQPCADRLVIEMQTVDTSVSDAFPGYRVEYVAEPIMLTAGEEVQFTLTGEATLLVTINAWLTTMDGVGYSGPLQVFPSNVEHIEEVRVLEMFEGVSVIGVGIDRERPFTVRVIGQRLVIDVVTNP